MRLVWLVVLAAALAALSAAPAGAAERTTVAVIGDSIVEGSHLRAPAREGLVARLRRAAAARGFDPGAPGFVASHPAELAPVVVTPAPGAPASGWAYDGAWAWLTRLPGARADLFSWTNDPAARATLRAAAPADRATLVYLTGPAYGRLRFSAGPERLDLDAHADSAGFGMATLDVPPGGPVSVAPESGAIGLVGAYLRRAPRPGRSQLEITAIAQGGGRAAQAPTPLEEAGLAALSPAVTVLVLGTNDGIGYARARDPRMLRELRDGIELRGRRARRTGACLVVPPARAHFPAGVFKRLRRVVEHAAGRAGCSLVPALDVLDGRPRLTADGVHPSRAGYRRIAAALIEPVLSAARSARG